MPNIKISLPGSFLKNSHIVVFSYQNAKKPLGSYVLGPKINTWLNSAKEDGFKGNKGEVSIVRPDGLKARRVLIVGLGPEKSDLNDSVRIAAATAVRTAKKLNLKSIVIRPADIESVQAAAEGTILGAYTYTKYKSNTKSSKLDSVTFLTKNTAEKKKFTQAVQQGKVFADATSWTRDLINHGPSDTTPQVLVSEARKVAKRGVKLRIYGKKQIERMGMGGILGVNRGSSKPPAFLHFSYKPSGRVKKRIGICGKGITFDSGGLSLKPPRAMETMKLDMAGAAAVFGIFKALSQVRPQVEVHGFTPLTENMPGANAQKPGDILKALGGKTIEVLNTDAEGRLVLADALGFASRQNLDEIVDIATLTGAAVVALGSQITAVMSTHTKLSDRLINAGKKAGEKMWELPLEPEYRAHMDSPVADIKNMGRAGEAGTIIGGLFLKEFVTNKKPWAHLDIAGPAFTNSPTPLSQPGGTGIMVRTLLNYILSYN